MKKQTKNNSVSYKLDLTGIKNYIKLIRKIGSEDFIRSAALDIQEKAFEVMKRKYLMTKAKRVYYGKRRKKDRSKRLEKRLFSYKPRPTIINSNTIEVKLINNYDKLIKELPHLIWQEYGTKSSVDTQPYRVGFSLREKRFALKPITKRKAATRRQVTNKWFFGGIVKLAVPHPALPARMFILEANNYLKRNGLSIVSKHINRLLGSKKK